MHRAWYYQQFHRFAQVSYDPLLPDIVLISLGDYQIPLVVRSHIQTGNNALGQALLAKRMGKPMPNYANEAEIFDELASVTPIMAGILPPGVSLLDANNRRAIG